MILSLHNIHKSYGNNVLALRGIDLDVSEGEIVCLLGPSGCGKTTLLRIVAGLEQPDRGTIYFRGKDFASVPVHQRGLGFMFQDFALFPHRSVAENIAFGLRMENRSARAIAARVQEMLDLVSLTGYGDRTVFELSGGERQRVALARSLATNPEMLMLDEPLGNLDRALREELLREVRSILKELGMTALYVTHDQPEAFAVADRIVVMRQGRIEQIDIPETIYRQPANQFVARFLGFDNLLQATLQPGHGDNMEPHLKTTLGSFTAPAHLRTHPPGNYTLLIRPEAVRLADDSDAQASTNPTGGHPDRGFAEQKMTHAAKLLLYGKLATCTFAGSEYEIKVSVGTQEKPHHLIFDLPSHQRSPDHDQLQPVTLPEIGAPIRLVVYPALMSLLPSEHPSG